VVTEAGSRVFPGDTVKIDGRPIRLETELRYIALYKPPYYLCSNFDPQGRDLAVDLLKDHYSERLFHVGRLDFLSEGLIFFTNDGDFAAKVSHPSWEIEKEYRLETNSAVDEALLRQAVRGVKIDGVEYRIKSFRIVSRRKIDMTLNEGKNREIRRLMKHFGIGIRRLIRLRIGPIELGSLEPGEFRKLSPAEVESVLNYQSNEKRRRRRDDSSHRRTRRGGKE